MTTVPMNSESVPVPVQATLARMNRLFAQLPVLRTIDTFHRSEGFPNRRTILDTIVLATPAMTDVYDALRGAHPEGTLAVPCERHGLLCTVLDGADAIMGHIDPYNHHRIPSARAA